MVMPALYQSNQDVPDSMLLGNLLTYTLTNMTVSEQDLLDTFTNNNLPQSYVRKISHADAFRRATSSIKNEKVVYTDDNGDQFDGRINVDEVVNDNMYVKRIVGVRVLNDQKEEVSYTQLGSIAYDRANDCCTTSLEPTSTQHVTNVSLLFDQVKVRYMTWSTYHNHDTIRNIINRVVCDMHPVALMSTGINKFIPKTSKDTLYALKGVLNDLSQYSDNGYGENVVEIIPFIDTQEQRDLVNKMYEEEIKETLYNYSMELAEILKKKQTLSSRQAATYVEKYRELSNKVIDYQGLLGTYTQNIHDQLQAAIQLINDNKES
jgi:hypothetical protein